LNQQVQLDRIEAQQAAMLTLLRQLLELVRRISGEQLRHCG